MFKSLNYEKEKSLSPDSCLLIFIFLKKNGDNTWHEQRDKQSITTKITGMCLKY